MSQRVVQGRSIWGQEVQPPTVSSTGASESERAKKRKRRNEPARRTSYGGAPQDVYDGTTSDGEQQSGKGPGGTPKRSLSSGAQPKSFTWEYFQLVDGSDGKKARCTLCDHTMTVHSGTSNFIRHLKSRHQIRPRVDVRTVKKFDERTNKLYVDELAELLVLEALPVSLTDSFVFQNWMGSINPRLSLPSSSVVSSTIYEAYERCKRAIVQELRYQPQVQLSLDVWSLGELEHYVAIGGHWLNEHLRSRSYILHVAGIASSQNPDDLSFEVGIAIERWGLQGKVDMLITDKQYDLKLDRFHLSHIACTARWLEDTLKATVNEMEEAAQLVDKLRSVLTLIRGDGIINRLLPDLVNRLASAYPYDWLSIQAILSQFCQLKDALPVLTSKLHKESEGESGLEASRVLASLPSPSEVEALTDMAELFALVSSAQNMLQDPNNGSFSLVVPTLVKLGKKVKSVTKRKSGLALKLAETLLARLENCKEPDMPALIASLLDARFKNLQFVSQDKKKEVQEALKKELLQRRMPQPPPSGPPPPTKGTDFFSSDEDESEDEEPRSFKQPQSSTPSLPYGPELAQYLGLPTEGYTADSSCIDWWQKRTIDYPSLCYVARRYLAIPPASVPFRRIFPFHANPAPELIGQLALLRSWQEGGALFRATGDPDLQPVFRGPNSETNAVV